MVFPGREYVPLDRNLLVKWLKYRKPMKGEGYTLSFKNGGCWKIGI
jgi:hypothetical protein